MRIVPGNRQRGVTLIELLAALLLSGFVVAMASRIFLSGHAQFLRRSADSEKLALFYRLEAEVDGGLGGEIASCSQGHLSVRTDSGSFDLGDRIRTRMPETVEARFRCLEPAPSGASLQDWNQSIQPALVEYHMRLRVRKEIDSLSGTWAR